MEEKTKNSEYTGLLMSFFAQKSWCVLAQCLRKSIIGWREKKARDVTGAMQAWDAFKHGLSQSGCKQASIETFRVMLSGSIEAAKQEKALAKLVPSLGKLTENMAAFATSQYSEVQDAAVAWLSGGKNFDQVCCLRDRRDNFNQIIDVFVPVLDKKETDLLDAEKVNYTEHMCISVKSCVASRHLLKMLNVSADIKTFLESSAGPLGEGELKKVMDLYAALQKQLDAWKKVADPAAHIDEAVQRFQAKYSVQSLAVPLLQQ